MAVDVFSVPVFLVVFREALETVIIVSVLLAFLKQTLDGPNRDPVVYKKLVRQVWLGTALGFLLCLIIGGALIGVFYTLGANRWEASELDYEGAFCLIASVIITIVGFTLLRIGKMQEKWRVKLAASMEAPVRTDHPGAGKAVKRFFEKYAMFVLPFITVLREGIEAIVFVAGVTFSAPATAVPLPVVVGLLVGAIVGYILYKSGSSTRLQIFLVISTCLLYLVAAGLFSRAVWSFEQQKWSKLLGGDVTETGSGAGSYDVDNTVWHVDCCSPYVNGGNGWGFFNAILGWTNSATYGSVISYNLYWLFVISALFVMRFREVKGRWPLMKAKPAEIDVEEEVQSGGSSVKLGAESKAVDVEKTVPI
ncbi:putative iron transferase [Apodospora peruviana]|uniref:Iron transferase n=1 Tax=Apodospora peruviana TaxID=516989 RepID=A0AAE0HXH4_9PEZI|nr:putative iron transferase [Apodospora peruviana]